MNKKIIFYVQHLLGIGHLKRVSIMAKLMSQKGLDVSVVSGGEKISNIDFGSASFFQLPPTRSKNTNYTNLIDERGNIIDDKWKKNREKLILNIFEKIKPDILITEMFPFGRRQMRFELLPLLEKAKKNNTIIISSIRDIIVSDLEKTKITKLNFLLAEYYNYILVHGEKKFYSIGDKLNLDKPIINKIFYTGYVCEKRSKSKLTSYNKKEIIVSAGGGAVGKKIIINAIKTSSLFSEREYFWRIIIGINENAQNKKEYINLINDLGKNIILENFTENFNNLLQNCLISISQGGYNTFIETISSRVKSIIIPYSGDIKSDQVIRANSFKSLGFIKYIDENDLNPSKLKDNIIQLINEDYRKSKLPDLNGSENTYKFITGLKNE